MKRIRVLVIDDSATVRETMKHLLESDPALEVIATASDPFIAAERIKREVPDVITLDIEMPRMDGLTFLEKLMSQCPVPVVMCSTLTDAGSATALAALERGAIDIISKPRLGAKEFLQESRIRICDTVKAAARARVPARGDLARRLPVAPSLAPKVTAVAPKLSADAVLAPGSGSAMIETTEKIVVIGASTGGTEALRELLESLTEDAPGLLIVQHMPERFTALFAARLNGLCRITVKEAADGDSVLRGQALIAPGNKHLLLKRSGARYYVEVRDGPLVSRHRPSVDVLFRSAARYAGRNALGVIMTGMGDDGASGLLEMKHAGAATLAQDEASCVVFGMPAEAIKRGAVGSVLPLSQLAPALLQFCQQR